MLTTTRERSARPPHRARGILPWLAVALAFVGRALLAGAYPAPADDSAAILARSYFRTHPDQAVARGVASEAIQLAPMGPAWIEWCRYLRSTLRQLEHVDQDDRPGPAFARLRAMSSWVESELILAETLDAGRTDPGAYVEQALRVFEGLRDSSELETSEREAVWKRCLEQLPAFLEDARLHVVDPNPVAIDRALEELTALEKLLDRPWAPEAEVPADGIDPATALTRFRLWLRDRRERTGGEPRRMGQRWGRYVQLATGTELDTRSIKALLLREMAEADAPYPQAASRRIPRSIPAETLQRGIANASANALTLARLLEVLGPGPAADRLRITLRESSSIETRCAVGTAGNRREERLAVLLPAVTWSTNRSAERWKEFFPRSLTALGLRHGMVGEALFAIAARAQPHPFTSTVQRRPLKEGFGLFALDWVPRLQHEHSPFLGDADLARAIDLQHALETARLLATLELHAEGLSFEEALVGFLRRTEVDPGRARAEVTRSLFDPAYGLGALVRHELLDLETRLERLLGPQKALPRLLRLLLENPDLRPADLPDAL